MTIRTTYLALFLAGFAAGVTMLLSCGSGSAGAQALFFTVYTVESNINSNYVSASNSYVPVGPPVPFVKVADATSVEVISNTRATIGGVTGTALAARFQLRVDGIPTSGDIQTDGAVFWPSAGGSLSLFAAFQGLPAGAHTAQVYVRSIGNGSVIDTGLDPGGLGGAIIVREVQ